MQILSTITAARFMNERENERETRKYLKLSVAISREDGECEFHDESKLLILATQYVQRYTYILGHGHTNPYNDHTTMICGIPSKFIEISNVGIGRKYCGTLLLETFINQIQKGKNLIESWHFSSDRVAVVFSSSLLGKSQTGVVAIFQAIFGDEKFYSHYLNADLFKVVYIVEWNGRVCVLPHKLTEKS